MVVTRSQSKPIKKTFTDDDFIDEEIVPQEQEVEEKEDEEEEEEEESDESDDEAPEEESTSKAREDILLKEKQRQDEEAELEKQRKERRKALDLRNKQQQELKKSKQKKPIELPEFLPDDIESIMNQSQVPEVKAKHIRLDEDIKPDRKSILEEKLRQLKQKKKVAVKKGPVYVKVQGNMNKKVVPKSESKIIKNRDKWLNRKSINRK